jgi:hypothetical protein
MFTTVGHVYPALLFSSPPPDSSHSKDTSLSLSLFRGRAHTAYIIGSAAAQGSGAAEVQARGGVEVLRQRVCRCQRRCCCQRYLLCMVYSNQQSVYSIYTVFEPALTGLSLKAVMPRIVTFIFTHAFLHKRNTKAEQAPQS